MATEMENIQEALVHECLRKQLEEYELLQSMYSNPGEFQTDNSHLIDEIQEFLDGKRTRVTEKLDYRLKLQLNEKLKIELSVILSQYYPTHEQPMLIIRTDSLKKHQEKEIKNAIENYIENDVDKSEPYMFQVITWLQDNIDEIVQIPIASNEDSSCNNYVEMKRVWLWSHHIYSKIKRHDIMRLTKDYDLKGFMWSGKPGVICFEGTSDNVDDVVKIVKSWQWQKIKTVKIEVNEDKDMESFSSFNDFQEIMCCEEDNESPMDSKAFFKYLESHGFAYMKKELFGFE